MQAKDRKPTIVRRIFVESQRMEIFIDIYEDDTYLLQGIPAEEAEEGNEVVPTQAELLKIYQDLGIMKKPNWLMGAIESVLGSLEGTLLGQALINNSERKAWANSGTLVKD